MLAYVFWHRPTAGAEVAGYEHAVERFHRSLASRPPSGFRGSAAFRVPEIPWMAGEDGYEDWYLVDDWASLGVLEEAATSHGHVTAHDAAASRTGTGTAAVYRLIEGSPRLGDASEGLWVAAALQREPGGIGKLLGDGIDPERDGLWQRCLVLGPAPEYCLLAVKVPAGAAAGRLPQGWSARSLARETIYSA